MKLSDWWIESCLIGGDLTFNATFGLANVDVLRIGTQYCGPNRRAKRLRDRGAISYSSTHDHLFFNL
jgi:hypothetical protein